MIIELSAEKAVANQFIELFFPELDRMLDHCQTRFLMQELLDDIVGQEGRKLVFVARNEIHGT